MTASARASNAMPPVPERNVMRCCLQWLAYHGVMAWRVNSGSMKAPDANRRRGFRYVEFNSIQGVSDILAVLPGGKLAAIEVKRSRGGVVSAHQAEFLRRVREAGGVGVVVRSIEELETALAEYVPTRRTL